MKSLTDAILTAETIGTKKEKHEALSGLGKEELHLIYEALNPYRIFNVKKFDPPTQYAAVDPLTYQPFIDLLDQLHNRELTGNIARHNVTRVLGLYTKRTASVLERVLRKDLKCGANARTFTEIYPELNIPSFDLMLCGKIEHVKNERGEITYPKYQWEFPCIGEVKYDGMRLIAMVENGRVEYISRSGKPADQWAGLFDDELIKLEHETGYPLIVDGEALSIEGFNATAKAKGSKNDKSAMRFFAFDWMSLAEWKAMSCLTPQLGRTLNLTAVIKKLNLKKIIKSDHHVLNDLNEAIEFYTQVIELGLPGQDEGLIIKQFGGRYEWNSAKRTMTWAKWKPVIDVDVKITGYYEGAKGTKNEGRLGGFIVEGEDENGNKIKSRCGGFKVNSKKFKDWLAIFAKENAIDLEQLTVNGISRDEFFRTYAFKHPELFIGQTCMIETQELSLAQNADTYSLRFPQFIMLRTDK